jgi:4-hydroxy-tetrahydrodipicolinate synthase
MTFTPSNATWLSGYIPDLPTPFDESGGIDLSALAKLCARQIAGGTSAIVVGETAGEASTLSADEWETVIRIAVETARGRLRILAGTGSNSTSKTIELTRRAPAPP